MPSSDSFEPDRESTDVVGARIGAQIVDVVVMFLQVLVVALALAALARPERPGTVRGFVGLGFLTLPLYGGLLEGYWNGQTVGKRLLDIKVVDPRGRDPSVGQAFVPNVPAIILFSWVTSAVALASMAMNDRRQRVFDIVANTYVVRSRPVGTATGSWDGTVSSSSSGGSRSRR